MPAEIEMPAGGAETGDSAWEAAEKGAAALESSLVAQGLPVPGAEAGAIQETDHSAEPAPKPVAKPPLAKTKGAEPAGDKAVILKQLEELAAKVGMKVDGNRVEVAERVALREEKRRSREQLTREQEQFRARMAEESGKFQGSAAKFEAFERAREANDFEGMAKAAGFADWKSLVGEHTKRLASPEYREIQELKRRDAEREATIKADREQQTRAQQAQQEATNVAAYKAGMADELKSSGGQLELMSGDPQVVNMLYEVRAEHYRATGEELELQEVLETPSKRFGGESVLDILEKSYHNLSKIFGDRPAQDEAASAATPRGGPSSRSRERKPPKTVSQRTAAEASAPPEFKDEAEFKRYFTSLLNQSTHTS